MRKAREEDPSMLSDQRGCSPSLVYPVKQRPQVGWAAFRGANAAPYSGRGAGRPVGGYSKLP